MISIVFGLFLNLKPAYLIDLARSSYCGGTMFASCQVSKVLSLTVCPIGGNLRACSTFS